MKKLLKLAVMAVGALSFQSAYAFHSGGVAECNGCHTMHNSFEGVAHDDDMAQFSSGPYLLKGNDQSSACLNCHSGPTLSGYHVATEPHTGGVNPGQAPVNLTPGGDFSWVKNTYTWTPRSGTTETSLGDRHGHNVVAADFGFAADGTLDEAPGGTYPAASLGCQSCHDPHGKFRRLADGSIVNGKAEPTLPIRGSGSYFTSADPVTDVYAVGVYRILGGLGYQPKSMVGNAAAPAFTEQVPAAVAPSSYNRTEAVTQTKVAYGSNMSEWCANCHGQIHQSGYNSGQPGLTHPAANEEVLDSFIVSNYNVWVKTGDLSGTVATAWNSLVPFEEGTADYAILKGKAADLSGPESGTENVMCLSCHRAHASGFDSMLRWSMAYEFITQGDAAGVPSWTGAAVARGKTATEQEAAYYGRTAASFAPYQRGLCNKCHVKD